MNKNNYPIPDATFFSIFDLQFSSNNSLSAGFKQSLTAIYTQMKKKNISCNNNFRGTFKQYFIRLNGTLSAAHTKEILEGLTNCLAKDSSCFGVWIKLHTSSYILNSAFLLEHLAQDELNLSRLNRKSVATFFRELSTSTNNSMPIKNGARCLSILEVCINDRWVAGREEAP